MKMEWLTYSAAQQRVDLRRSGNALEVESPLKSRDQYSAKDLATNHINTFEMHQSSTITAIQSLEL